MMKKAQVCAGWLIVVSGIGFILICYGYCLWTSVPFFGFFHLYFSGPERPVCGGPLWPLTGVAWPSSSRALVSLTGVRGENARLCLEKAVFLTEGVELSSESPAAWLEGEADLVGERDLEEVLGWVLAGFLLRGITPSTPERVDSLLEVVCLMMGATPWQSTLPINHSSL